MRFHFAASFAASIVGAALVFGGCAANTAESSTTEETSEALTTLGKQLVGDYSFANAKGNFEEFDRLSIQADGSYAGDKPNPTKGAPITESGNWFTAYGQLVLHPAHAGARRYDVSVASDGSGMKLTQFGTTHTERFDKILNCTSDADCVTGDECRFVPNCPNTGIHCLSGHNACVKVAAFGESCGFRTQTTPCARDLDCRHVSGPLDALTCAEHIAQYDEACGGFFAHAAICADGLQCAHMDSDGTLLGNPDLPGRCRAAEGSVCGGNMTTAHQCAYPLHCQTTNPDVAGTCAQ
jgi:hypothetical protein